eukprot:g5144.t1
MLLVQGLGATMINWPTSTLCKALASEGYFVIIYDNRDSGRSTYFSDFGKPSLPAHFMSHLLPGGHTLGPLFGLQPPPYTLDDIAEDGILLLDALNIEKAHLVGASMGGMLAQLMAINFPDRFLSLCSIMSDTGDGTRQRASYRTLAFLFIYLPAVKPTPGTVSREEQARHDALGIRFNMAEDDTFDGGTTPEGKALEIMDYVGKNDREAGKARQLIAIVGSQQNGGPRTEALQHVTLPAVVVHGIADKLVPVVGGLDTAQALGNCRKTCFIPHMGHELSDRLIGTIVEAIVENARFADGGGGGAGGGKG